MDEQNEINGFTYSTDQIADLYAKLEVAKMLIKMGTELAKTAETDIKFYRLTNNIPDN